MPNSIKALILDVDGVLVGEDSELNFPEPNEVVIKRLKAIRNAGLGISLCTSRPIYSVQGIIDKAHLDNMHIGLGGATVIDPIDNKILDKFPIDTKEAQDAVSIFIKNNIYTEIYGLDDYYLQLSQKDDLTRKHSKILLKNPVLVDSLLDKVENQDIYKILPVARSSSEIEKINKLFESIHSNLIISWAVHPSISNHFWGNITAKNISKRHATNRIANSLNISPSEILGVGDGISDWQFMDLCGYVAAMGNAPNDLKKLVISRGEKGYVGKSIDENGVLDIFDHYGL